MRKLAVHLGEVGLTLVLAGFVSTGCGRMDEPETSLGSTRQAVVSPEKCAAQGKVLLCHVSEEDPTTLQTLCVAEPSVPAHIAHGDTLGACEVPLPEVVAAVVSPEKCAAQGKALICHTPPGNPDNARTLCVAPDAVVDHVTHGDLPGACVPPLPVP